jgi:hypothetical protein
MADVVAQILATPLREFCRQHHISKSTFYNLQKAGLAPRTMRIGNRQLVTNEAAAEWRSRMEQRQAERAGGGK